MASNIPITNGQGQSSVAAEEIASLKYQQIKVVDGTASSTNAWVVDATGAGKVTTGNASIIAVVQGSIAATAAGNQSVSGTVGASIIGVVPITGTVIADLQQPAIVLASQGGAPWSFVGSVQGSIAAVIIGGSITAISAANQSVSGTVGASVIGWVPIQPSNTSIITVSQGSSIIAVPTGNQSVSGTVGASVIGWVPIQASNTSIITVSQTSSVVALTAPLASLVQGVADLRVVQGASVAALASPGAGIRLYVTNVQISNFGPSSVLVKISDNTTSTLGWSIAPAGGGSNYRTWYRAAANSPVTASINGTSSVIVSMQGFTA